MTVQQIRISALSYSNTFPFVYGLQKNFPVEAGSLQFEVPALSAKKFSEGKADIALVPVGALPNISSYKIISDYCIGSNGPVKTVNLYSNKPLNQIQKIALDHESRTSANLVKILAKHHWHILPNWVAMDDISSKDSDAFLFIGDKTFEMESKYKHVWDLSLEWKKMTGLPFVFAVWVANENIDNEAIKDLDKALEFGLNHKNDLSSHFELPVSNEIYLDYLNHAIDFVLDDEKKKAMNLYLKYLHDL